MSLRKKRARKADVCRLLSAAGFDVVRLAKITATAVGRWKCPALAMSAKACQKDIYDLSKPTLNKQIVVLLKDGTGPCSALGCLWQGRDKYSFGFVLSTPNLSGRPPLKS